MQKFLNFYVLTMFVVINAILVENEVFSEIKVIQIKKLRIILKAKIEEQKTLKVELNNLQNKKKPNLEEKISAIQQKIKLSQLRESIRLIKIRLKNKRWNLER
ncbi:hypothetical protein BDAP_001023 [Binucleata daphniae]